MEKNLMLEKNILHEKIKKDKEDAIIPSIPLKDRNLDEEFDQLIEESKVNEVEESKTLRID